MAVIRPGIFVAALALIAGTAVLLIGEGLRVHREWTALGDVARIVDAPYERLDPSLQGRVVIVDGDLVVPDELKDPVYAVGAKTLRLERRVEVYQWIERTEGGVRHYSSTWSGSRVDSAAFAEPGHDNPREFPIENASWNAEEVRIGAYRLSSELIPLFEGELRRLEPAHVFEPLVPTPIGKPAHRTDEGWFFGESPASPKPGDFRLSHWVVEPDFATIIAVQSGELLISGRTSNGIAVGQIRSGQHTADELLADQLPASNSPVRTVILSCSFSLLALGSYVLARSLFPKERPVLAHATLALFSIALGTVLTIALTLLAELPLFLR